MVNNVLFKSGYPVIYAKNVDPITFYSAYIHSYIERDVRQLINVRDLRTFQKFLGLCARRIGQLLSLSDLATNCGVSVPTINKWLSILEASYVLFLLRPHFNDFNKRLTKTPKLFFYDTGIACSLLGITSPDMLSLSPFRGHLFENLIISDLSKQFFNRGQRPPLYFWRDRNGRIEVDCIIDIAMKLFPIEIKSSQTIASSFFNGLEQWDELSNTKADDTYVIYAGDTNQTRSKGHILGWKSSSDLVSTLYRKSFM
jgi:uncharacterized protein